MSDKIRVRKTLVIGLGGTGRDAVLNVKRRYLEAYGPNELPTIQFLVFDTTDHKPLPVENGEPISLSPGEFYKMSVPNPQLVAEVNDEVKAWFPREKVQMRSIARGAGQVRAVGRLALFHNAVEVKRRIKAALDRLNGIRPHQDLGRFELAGDAVLVNVVGSLSGGTGSGTFLDVAYVCRHYMQPSRDLLVSYLLLPDVFAGRPGTENVEPNTYAAIKELDMLMDRMADETDELKFGGETIPMRTTPFDMVYLVNNRNRRGQVFNEVRELTELLGTGIFIASGAGGQEAGDVWDNLQRQLQGLASYGGKRPHYASFGVGEIVLDVKRFTREQQLRHAALAAESLCAPASVPTAAADPNEAMRREVEDFLGELNMNTVDKLRGALDPAGTPVSFSIDPTRSPNEWESDLRQKGRHITEQESRTRTRVEERLTAIREDAKTRVAARSETLVGGAGGLSRAVQFFTRVAGALDERHAQAETRLQGFTAGAPSVREEFEKRMKELQAKQKYLGRVLRKRTVLSAAENVGASVDQETALAVDVVRYAAAAAAITGLRGEVRDVAERLQRLLDRLSRLGTELRSPPRMETGPRPVRPFTIELPCPEHLKAQHRVQADDVLAYMAKRGLDLLKAESQTDDELKELFTGFASDLHGIADLGDFEIEDLFREPAFLRRYVELLDQVADPMWQYETAYLHGGRGTHTIYIFGVGNEDRTNFRSDEVAEALSSSHHPQVTSTNDRQRIYCYKIEAAIPGFALDRMINYQERYNQGEGLTFHVDGNWQETASDLWPPKNGGEHSANGAGHGAASRVPVDKIVSDATGVSGNGADPANGHASGAVPAAEGDAHGLSSPGEQTDAGTPPGGPDASP